VAGSKISEEEKYKYFDFVRSRMNQNELYVTFYHTIYHAEVHRDEIFLKLIDGCGLLQYLEPENADHQQMMREYFPNTIFEKLRYPC
jgi:trans-aconitate methyltransferase